MLVCPHRGGYPKVPAPPSKVPTPPHPRYLPLGPRYIPPVQGTYPLSKVPTPLVQGTYPPWSKVPTPIQGTYPPSKVPTPHPSYLSPVQSTYPPPDRTSYEVLHTLQSVCLLRSCRRTFLFDKVFQYSRRENHVRNNVNQIENVLMFSVILKYKLHGS